MTELIDKYIMQVREKLHVIAETKHTGNIIFQFNVKDGGIGNMTVTVTQSYKESSS